jgi:hypothetical protein
VEGEALQQVFVLLRIFHEQAEIGLVGLAEGRELVGNGFPVRKGCKVRAHDRLPENRRHLG